MENLFSQFIGSANTAREKQGKRKELFTIYEQIQEPTEKNVKALKTGLNRKKVTENRHRIEFPKGLFFT